MGRWALRSGVGVTLTMSWAMLGSPVPSSALGQVVPDPIVAENIGSAAQFYAAESGAADLPCDTGCQALKLDLRRAPTVPTDPVEGRVIKSFVDPSGSSIRSPWRLPVARLFAAGALVEANVYVWKVKVLGARPKDYFIKVPTQAFSAADVSYWQTVRGRDDVDVFPTYFGLPEPLPVGVIAMSAQLAAVLWNTGTNPATGGPSRCGEPGPVSTPAFIEQYTWHWNRCFEGYVNNVEVYSNIIAHGWKVSIDKVFESSLDAIGAPDTPQTYYVNGEQLTQAEIEQRIGDLLNSSDRDYETLRRWINSVFGGEERNPRDEYLSTPSCTGVTAATCSARFRAAGFTGTITTNTLTAADAVIEQAPGRVTDTIPGPGFQIARGAGVAIYVNPTTLPKLSAAETSVANTLQANNPQTVSAANKKTLARSCVRYAKVAGRANADCTSLPILVQGNDVAVPARNEIGALARKPSWFALNRRVPPTPRLAWYDNRADPSPGCLTAERRPIAAQCDEFPFWSTLQAYNGTLNSAVPGIRWVPKAENGQQGRVLSQFYSANAPGPILSFRGCNITAQSAADTVPLRASTFLNLPMPAGVPIASRGICNKP